MITQAQPVAIAELVKQAVSNAIKLLIIFGLLAWSAEQAAAVLIVVDSTLALVLGFWTLRRTTAIAAPVRPTGAEVRIAGTPETVIVPAPNGMPVDPEP